MSPDSFDLRVSEDVFPKPIMMGKRKVWDIRSIDHRIDIMSGLANHDITMHEESPVEFRERVRGIIKQKRGRREA